jgi:hypothetical protein
MSLFDVIKYPLSIPVMVKEFEALPEQIRYRYTRYWNGLSNNNKFNKPPEQIRNILITLLSEYNDPI